MDKETNVLIVQKLRRLFKKLALLNQRILFGKECKRDDFVGRHSILESLESRSMSWRRYCLFVSRSVIYKLTLFGP